MLKIILQRFTIHQIEWKNYVYSNDKMEAMNRKLQKTKEITILEQVADKQLLKESMMKRQAEI